MAGKSWQKNHEPPAPRGKTATPHTDKTVEETEGGREGEKQKLPGTTKPLCKHWLGLCSKNVVYTVSTWTPGACAQRDTVGHGATLALFVVNSVKLHLFYK